MTGHNRFIDGVNRTCDRGSMIGRVSVVAVPFVDLHSVYYQHSDTFGDSTVWQSGATFVEAAVVCVQFVDTQTGLVLVCTELVFLKMHFVGWYLRFEWSFVFQPSNARFGLAFEHTAKSCLLAAKARLIVQAGNQFYVIGRVITIGQGRRRN